jgi:hypothetical protein
VSHRGHAEILLGSHSEERSWLTVLGASRCVNHLQAVLDPNASHDAMDVVLYCLLGEVEDGGDFLVCKPLTYKWNNLLLPPCKAEIKLNPRAWNSHLLLRKSSE